MNQLRPCRKALLVFNSATGQPGRIGTVLAEHGFAFDIRRPGEGDDLPRDMSPYEMAVVFGGPMSANDTGLPNIAKILDWLPHVVASDTRYLGVCLGAQLMARHLGAPVAPHPEGLTEIGYYPVYPTAAGAGLIPDGMMVYHWHSEGFGVPEGAELLAHSDAFPHQAYHIDGRIWGIQFHPEVDDELHEVWLGKAADKTDRPNAQNPDQQRQGRAAHDEAFGQWFRGFAASVLLESTCEVEQSADYTTSLASSSS